jgi:hypothetical protein
VLELLLVRLSVMACIIDVCTLILLRWIVLIQSLFLGMHYLHTKCMSNILNRGGCMLGVHRLMLVRGCEM